MCCGIGTGGLPWLINHSTTPRKAKFVYKPVHSTCADKLTGKACRS